MEEQIWSVSQLNENIKDLLEDGFFPLWLVGEVGNLTIHRSGHLYCTLKDNNSQISCVFFKGSNQAEKMNLKEGQLVEVYGKITVYQPRGNYQINISKMRVSGIGQLQKKFEELKNKLQKEGLFDQERKRPIPKFPQKIIVITSPQGAAIQDFINIVKRRFNSLEIIIYPVPVQGEGSAKKIAEAIKWCNTQKDGDAIIITRGGGSLEDLWEFNEEILARSIVQSRIPIISAVGHEVDFTICDFVADLRVPTPSVAAEIIIDTKENFLSLIKQYHNRLSNILNYTLTNKRNILALHTSTLKTQSPQHKLQIRQQLLDEMSSKITFSLQNRLHYANANFVKLKNQLQNYSPLPVIKQGKMNLSNLREKLIFLSQHILNEKKKKSGLLYEKLQLVNPKNILKRGYAIVQDKNNKIINNPDDVASNQDLEITLAKGKMTVRKK